MANKEANALHNIYIYIYTYRIYIHTLPKTNVGQKKWFHVSAPMLKFMSEISAR